MVSGSGHVLRFGPDHEGTGTPWPLAVEAFARFAFTSRDVEATTREAVRVAMEIAHASSGGVFRRAGPTTMALVHGVGELGLEPGKAFEVSKPELDQAFLQGAPTVVGDWGSERRVSGPGPVLDAGVVSSISATVLSGRVPWGRLAVNDVRARRFAPDQVAAVQSVAHLLGAALDLERRERGQGAVAAFGRAALESAQIADTIEGGIEVAMAVLDAPLAVVTQLRDRADRIVIVTGRGDPVLAPGAALSVAPELDVAYRGQEPLVVDDWDDEPRFSPTPLWRTVGARSSVSVAIGVGGRPWGRLAVMDVKPRRFSAAEVDVVQSIAHTLSAALVRQRIESAQRSVAALGAFALNTRDLRTVLDRGVQIACEALQAPIGLVARVRYEPEALIVEASAGIDGWLAGHAIAAPGLPEQEPDAVAGGSGPDDGTVLRALLPAVPGDWTGLTAVLTRDGRAWGYLSIQDHAGRDFSEAEVDVMRALAHVLCAALERDRIERAQAAVVEFGRLALESRDLEATIRHGVKLVTAGLDAPMGLVVRARDGRGGVEVVHSRGIPGMAAGHTFTVDPAVDELLRPGTPLVVRDWRTEVRVRSGQAAAAGARSSLAAVALVDGAAWGTLAVMDTRTRAFDDADIDFIESMVHILAAAVQRDLADAKVRERARELQRALLPADLPVLAGVQVAVRYAPAGGDEVGGDWYDVLPLPRGGVGLVMGDVEGHDSAAAAVMGQVRSALRAYAGEGHSPAQVMRRVNQFVTEHTDRLVSCCYAELDPDQRLLTTVSCGHPPPLVLTLDGVLAPIPVRPGLILGVDADQRYETHSAVIPSGATLLLTTDGLVDEFRGAVHPDHDAFAAVARAQARAPIDTLAQALVDPAGAPHPQRDDAAVLAVRLSDRALPAARSPVDPTHRTHADQAHAVQIHQAFDRVPASVPAARDLVRRVTGVWGMAHLVDAAALVVSELITNAVEHTDGEIDMLLRKGEPGELWVCVQDQSHHRPRMRQPASDDTGGRGLTILDALSADWGCQLLPDQSGKIVWARLDQRADDDGDE